MIRVGPRVLPDVVSSPIDEAGAMNENTNQVRTFRRSRDNRVIAGVCGGAAELLGIDATIVRVLLVIATLFGFGSGVLVYLICWLVVPES